MRKLFTRKEAEVSAASTTVRTTVQGDVVGFVADNGAHVWRGLPFAASTAGANRWRAPQPAPAWEGVREALELAERCAQLTNEFDANEGLRPGLVVGSEDCLTLDVYAPADAKEEALPVMVWIHRGGNVWGRSSKYDGSRLARNEDVIVVAVQYRVGPLGWFAHEALRANAETPEDACACFATLDLIASLKWVRDNIAAFGGDPDNVTIFGESAGAHNVVTLLASPLAKGLFHRAIVQSGAFDSTPLAEAEGNEGELLNPSGKIAEKLNADAAEELRAVPVDRLLAAYTRGRGFVDVPRVIQDGVVLPAGPLRDAFASTDTFNAVPVMLGTNRDEMKLFYLGDDRMTKKTLGVFVVAREQDTYDALTGYLTRVWRIRSVDEPAAMMTAAGHQRVYAYRFDWDDGGRLLFMDFEKVFGAAHGFEIPFVFNRFQHLGDADRVLFQKKTLDDRERLSRAIGAYWASFARDGVPSCKSGPTWPVYGQAGGSFLRLDANSDGGIEVVHAPDSLEALVADLNEDPRIDRCLVVEEIHKWMFGRPIHGRLQAATGCK
jgi:para-nitrobenzyl esterase